MKTTRTIRAVLWLRKAILLFAALTFVCAASSTATVTRWFCEGRVCGISFGAVSFCCCATGDTEKQDNRCKTARRASAAPQDAITCADGCGCQGKTIRAGGELAAGTARAGTAPEPFLAVLSAPPAVAAPSGAVSGIAFSFGGRGPPSGFPAPRTRSLRAPPIA